MSKIYIDTCVWCRPFDKPTKKTLREQEAFLEILRRARKGEVEIIGSVVLDYEISQISDSLKRDDVANAIALFESRKISEVPARLRDGIIAMGLKPIDATHLAIAILDSEYFISVDKEILSRRGKIEKRHKIKIRDPVEFVMEVK